MTNPWKILATFAAASALTLSALAVTPAAVPATKPAADAQAELEKLTGSQLNIRAQQAFNRGSYHDVVLMGLIRGHD